MKYTKENIIGITFLQSNKTYEVIGENKLKDLSNNNIISGWSLESVANNFNNFSNSWQVINSPTQIHELW